MPRSWFIKGYALLLWDIIFCGLVIRFCPFTWWLSFPATVVVVVSISVVIWALKQEGWWR